MSEKIILDIYQQYSIPTNLQRHMLATAAVADLVCKQIDVLRDSKDVIVKTMLLHDMGNILKFNFDRIDLFDAEDQPHLKKYQQAQQEFRRKYGGNSDDATLKIISEITNDAQILQLCAESHWEKLQEYLYSDRLDIKTCIYSDMRIGPFGLLSLEERIADIKIRRPQESEQLNILLEQGLVIEAELERLSHQRLHEITQEKIDELIINLQQTLF